MTIKNLKLSLAASDLSKIKKMEQHFALRSAVLYLQVYLAIFFAIYISSHISLLPITVATIIFIAGRQHSLYILNHDASHYALFKSRRINKWVAIVLSNLVMFHHPEAWSFIQWRRIHLKHHSALFTENDPNYVSRKVQGDTKKSYTNWQLLSKCLLAIPQSWQSLFFGKQDYVSADALQLERQKLHHLTTLFLPFKNDKEMNKEQRLKLIFFIFSFSAISYFNLLIPFLIYWLLPMYTVYPMILKYNDLTEHNWHKNTEDLNLNTNSVRLNWPMKVLISFLPRSYHREHHLFPKVSVIHLPKVHTILTSNKMK